MSTRNDRLSLIVAVPGFMDSARRRKAAALTISGKTPQAASERYGTQNTRAGHACSAAAGAGGPDETIREGSSCEQL
jgi:hypothetical protein